MAVTNWKKLKNNAKPIAQKELTVDAVFSLFPFDQEEPKREADLDPAGQSVEGGIQNEIV